MLFVFSSAGSRGTGLVGIHCRGSARQTQTFSSRRAILFYGSTFVFYGSTFMDQIRVRRRGGLLLRRHARLQLLEPVEDDLDLRRGGRAAIGGSGFLHHHETPTVR